MICKGCDYDDELVVTETYTLLLSRAAQSLNTVGVNSRNNRAYRGSRRRWERLLVKYSHLKKATGPRRIYFCRYWGKGKRAYDFGNLVGGFKPLLDMICKLGLLINDAPNNCSEYYRQQRDLDGNDYVIVVIEEYEENT